MCINWHEQIWIVIHNNLYDILIIRQNSMDRTSALREWGSRIDSSCNSFLFRKIGVPPPSSQTAGMCERLLIFDFSLLPESLTVD